MKNRLQEKITLRAKIKSFDTAEVVITSVETGEVQVERIPILIGNTFPTEDSDSVKKKRSAQKKKADSSAQDTPTEEANGDHYDDDSDEAE